MAGKRRTSADLAKKTQRFLDDMHKPIPPAAVEAMGRQALASAVLAVHDAGVAISNETLIAHLRSEAARSPAGELPHDCHAWALARIGGKVD